MNPLERWWRGLPGTCLFLFATLAPEWVEVEGLASSSADVTDGGHEGLYPWIVHKLVPKSEGPLLERQQSLRGFGDARYQDWPLPSWEDMEVRGRHGATCDPGGSVRAQCGHDLVCRQGICRRCMQDSECPSLHRCVELKVGEGNSCVPLEKKAWEQAFTNWAEGLCTVAIFFASALAAAAGTGGGGMFVPLLVSLSGLKAEQAVPLSQVMILCGSLVNLSVFLSVRHPQHADQPVIDYDCVVLLEPMLCLGVMCGVLVNRISPQWLLLLLLFGTLGVALHRTSAKGFQQLHVELNAPAPPMSPRSMTPVGRVSSSDRGAREDESTPRLIMASLGRRGLVSEDFLELTNMKAWQVILTVVVWLVMLASSFHGMPICTSRFMVFMLELAGLLLLCTYIAGRSIRRTAEGVAAALAEGRPPAEPKAPIDWTGEVKPESSRASLGILQFPAAAFGAGFLGGLLGLGGGIVMGPVLLEVGMHSEAVQATTAVFVFLSSSLATIQFARLKQYVWDYVLWYGFVTTAATILGQHLCEVYVRKRRRYSIITLAIAGVLLASLVALATIGTLHVAEDFYFGRQMWFSKEQLCNRDGVGILSVDIVPAQPWPSDLPINMR